MRNLAIGVTIGLLVGGVVPAFAQSDLQRAQWALLGIVMGQTANYIVRMGMSAARQMQSCTVNPRKQGFFERAGRVYSDPGTNFDEAMAVIRACGTGYE